MYVNEDHNTLLLTLIIWFCLWWVLRCIGWFGQISFTILYWRWGDHCRIQNKPKINPKKSYISTQCHPNKHKRREWSLSAQSFIVVQGWPKCRTMTKWILYATAVSMQCFKREQPGGTKREACVQAFTAATSGLENHTRLHLGVAVAGRRPLIPPPLHRRENRPSVTSCASCAFFVNILVHAASASGASQTARGTCTEETRSPGSPPERRRPAAGLEIGAGTCRRHAGCPCAWCPPRWCASTHLMGGENSQNFKSN